MKTMTLLEPSASSVTFNTSGDMDIPLDFNEVSHVTLGGMVYTYRYSTIGRWEIPIEYMVKVDAAIINSWRTSNTLLYFYPDIVGAPERYFRAYIAKDTDPLSKMTNLGWDSFFSGKLVLETPDEYAEIVPISIVFFWRLDLMGGSIAFQNGLGDYQDTTVLPNLLSITYLEPGISSSVQKKVGSGCLYCESTYDWWGNLITTNPFKDIPGFKTARIGFWAKRSNNNGNQYYIPICDAPNQLRTGFQLLWGNTYSDNTLRLYSQSTLIAEMALSNDFIQWTFYEVAWNGRKVSWYVNGVKLGESNYLAAIDVISTGNFLGIGSMYANYRMFAIDNLMVSFNPLQNLYLKAFDTGYPVALLPSTQLYLRFDEGQGSRTFTDDTGLHNFNFIGGAMSSTANKKMGISSLYIPPISVNAAYIDNNTDIVLGIGGAPFTVDFWCIIESIPGLFCSFFGMGGGYAGWNTTTGHIIWFGVYNGKLMMQYWTGALVSVENIYPFPLGSWHHLALVNDDVYFTIYLDGVSIYQTPKIVLASGPSQNIRFMIGSTSSLDYTVVWGGYIDSFGVSDYARWTGNFTPPQ